MTVRAGDQHKMCRVERKTMVKGLSGEEVKTWVTWKTRRLKVEPLTGNERFLAQQRQPEVQFKVSGRFIDGVKAVDRITYKGMILRIISVQHVKEAHRQTIMMCAEWSR